MFLLLLIACNATNGNGSSPDLALPEGVELGDVVACEAPADRPSWTDVAELRGLEGTDLESHGAGGTTVVEDLDGDGDLDLAIGYSGVVRFYLRDGDRYTMETTEAQVDTRLLTLGDLGRGYPEVVLGGSPIRAFHYGSEGLEERYLLEDSASANRVPAQGAFPADIDGDGNVDLYAMQTAPEGTDNLLWGVGDGWFEADFEGIPEGTRSGRGFDARWFDYDLDRDLDLYVANDMGEIDGPNVLYRNDDGVLVDVSDSCSCALVTSSMGVDAGDFSGDGWPDLYVSISGNQALLQAMGDGSYLDVTRAVGIPAQGAADMGWGAAFFDLENDGDLDIFEARGDLWTEAETANMFDIASRVLQNDDGAFSDTAAEWGLDTLGSWRTFIPFDDNGDGVLDLLLTSVNERPKLWVSDSCTTDGWLDVEAPIGAQVEIEADGRTQTGWVTQQSAMGGSKPAIAHFGLGDTTTVDRMTVIALGGKTWTVNQPFEGRRRVVVEP